MGDIDASIVSADYEDYAFVQFTLDTEDVTLFETDVNTAGTTDTDAGLFASGDAQTDEFTADDDSVWSISARYEIDGDDIIFDVTFSNEGFDETWTGSVAFDMDDGDADILTFWWLSDFHVPPMENFNGDATADLTVNDDDLKDNWGWEGYNIDIGTSARVAVKRAVAAPDADNDVSFEGDDFAFSWVFYEGTRNEFETNEFNDEVTVTFPEEEEEEEEGGEEEESEEESSSASMIVSSIVSLLS